MARLFQRRKKKAHSNIVVTVSAWRADSPDSILVGKLAAAAVKYCGKVMIIYII